MQKQPETKDENKNKPQEKMRIGRNHNKRRRRSRFQRKCHSPLTATPKETIPLTRGCELCEAKKGKPFTGFNTDNRALSLFLLR